MALGVIAKKCGMTRIFDKESGASIPVTVVHVTPNKVTQCKSKEKEGYVSVQVTRGEQKPQRLSKPVVGHFAKAKVVPGEGLWEFRLESEDNPYSLGTEFAADLFQVGQYVDVTGVTKGRGFSGSIRRHHFRSQRASHGNSLSHRAPGSIGQNQSPGRVFKGKRMAGQHGNARRTTQNLKIIQVDTERQVLLIQGAVPGVTGGFLMIRPAVKRKVKSNDAK